MFRVQDGGFGGLGIEGLKVEDLEFRVKGSRFRGFGLHKDT